MKYTAISILALTILSTPLLTFAMEPDMRLIWEQRPDLRAAFNEDGSAIDGSAAGFLIDIEDWARQYGWQVEPELSKYRPEVIPPRHVGGQAPLVDSRAWIVVDKNSGAILGASNAEAEWPIASITKLMTSDIVTENAKSLEAWQSVYDTDDVGGAKIWVDHGAHFRLNDLLYATLVGSANNAANAVARSLGGTKIEFIAYMNERAWELGLRKTTFADPSGMEVDNVSTAREVAYFAREIFERNEVVRRMTQTYKKAISDTAGNNKTLTTTNWMLYKPQFDDVWVMAGKTGFLHESKWNVVEQLRPSRWEADKELVVVVLGSETRGDSFDNVNLLSDWAWENFRW